LVDCWPCQVAVTPILDRVGRPGVIFSTETLAGVSGLGVTFSSASSSRHVGTSFEDVRSPTTLPDITSLCGRTGRRPRDSVSRDHENLRFSNDLRRTVQNPLRSDRFLPTNTAACHLNASIPKLRALSNGDLLPSDGAYPRRERRGIAPVQLISSPSASRTFWPAWS